jgi:hypothetical protein
MSDLRARLNKIIDLHGKALVEAVGQREPTSQEAQLPAKDLILRFAGSDPTSGKSRTQWLIKTYIQDSKFKLEDLGRTDAALAAFERFKRKLPVEQREINHLKTLSTLEELVAPFVRAEAKARLERDLSTATGREKRRLEEWKARDESIVIQEGKGIPTIAVPMTEFSSKWWGRGTQWCTAADKNNAFAHYNANAPLIIIVCPDGAKFQMHATKDSFQFMDNTDTTVSKKIIEERWNEFQTLLYWATEQNGEVLQYVPEEFKTPALCNLAVEQNGLTSEFVPKEYMTSELCHLAVKQNGLALEYVLKKYGNPQLWHKFLGWLDKRTIHEQDHVIPELCRLAVEQNGFALAHVPIKLQTLEIGHLAVQQNGQALYFIPEKYRTPELCRIAEQQRRITYKDNRTPKLLTVISPGQPKWHPDILQGLCSPSQFFYRISS